MTEATVTPEQLLDAAIASLGTLEVRAEQERIYFDDLAGWLRFEFERDERGKVVSATRDGKPADVSYAIRIDNQLKRARLYYDLEARTFRGQGLDSINRGDLAKAITARAEEIVAENAEASDDAPDQVQSA